jgi:hypothetical protein
LAACQPGWRPTAPPTCSGLLARIGPSMLAGPVLQARTITRIRSLPWRPVPFVLGLAAAMALFSSGSGGAPADRTAGLLCALGNRGLVASADGVVWLDPVPAHTLAAVATSRRALVRARSDGDAHDVYLVRARLSPDGAVLGVVDTRNLTRTPSADESIPLVQGNLCVYSASIEGVPTAVFALNLDGEQIAADSDMSRMARAQIALTNLQETGQLSGIGRRGWTFDPSPCKIELSLASEHIEVIADGRRIHLPRRSGLDPEMGAGFVRPHRTARARPGNLVTWAVDRVRNSPWFGDDRMQALKAAVFKIGDLVVRIGKALAPDSSAKDIASDLGDVARTRPSSYTDPETGWPPPPMKPHIVPSLPGEGEWVLLVDDPFLPTNPGNPAAFATSFIRTDRDRQYTRVYVTIWDPRQVAMHMMAGTVEPIGATGEAGPGLVPRTPEILGRLVAATNGGFQATHGEWGMMGDGIVYLPPKPYAATVAALSDGSTGFGEWPLSQDVPEGVVSFRQNLTALVKDEKFNPYGRTWWGGTPPDQEDKVHAVRTGICLTRERFIGYFYGAGIAAEVLAQAMIDARCTFGIHLDMNVGHTGLEFYRVAPTSQLPVLNRPLQTDWEAEGRVRGLEGWSFRGRRMVRDMPLMNFPRYIHREARDFFYMTLRHLLPGPDIQNKHGAPNDGHWTTRGLPQHGYPFAVATTTIHPVPGRPDLVVALLRVDPRMVQVVGANGVDPSAPTVVVFSGIARSKKPHPTLWLGKNAFAILPEPAERAIELFSGLASGDATAPSAEAAVGISDEDGMLTYAQLDKTSARIPGERGGVLDALLASLGCSSPMLLAHSLEPALGGSVDLTGDAATMNEGATLRLVRAQGPGARSIFEDTPIVSPAVWQPLQLKRVRYFKKPAPAASTTSEGADTAGPADDPGAK